ncbi:nucleotide-diphospho-sugar transferase, partial [Martensiomyces pterosporus]
RFNRKHHYPYLFLNDEPFSEEFMQLIAASTTSNVTFALIPRDHWSLPDFIDEDRALEARQQMAANNVIYGGSLSYRHMCRFNSGFFYKHPLLKSVDWYWRVEPGVDFYCDLDYDPFHYMQDNGKMYSFVIALKELESTIPTLWEHTLNYMAKRNISSDLMQYFVAETGDYNLCHFWSNFEIASLNWLRSDAYESYFQYLDTAEGFFMERWGDAPVHSIAAGMLLSRDQVHFFDDIGYKHADFARCPDTATSLSMNLKCQCPLKFENFDTSRGSCLPQWKAY